MDHERHLAAGDARAFRHPKKILQTRRHPRRLAALIMNLRIAAAIESQARRRDLIEHLRIPRTLQSGN